MVPGAWGDRCKHVKMWGRAYQVAAQLYIHKVQCWVHVVYTGFYIGAPAVSNHSYIPIKRCGLKVTRNFAFSMWPKLRLLYKYLVIRSLIIRKTSRMLHSMLLAMFKMICLIFVARIVPP